MKSKLLGCVVALLALFAASCGSETTTVLSEAETTLDSSASDVAADDTMADEDAMEDDDTMAEDAAMADEDHSADDTMAEDAAMEDDEANTDDTMADDEAMEDDDTMAEDAAMADEEAMGDAPQRIISLSPTSTEMLFAIGAGDQVVAVDAFSYYPDEAPVTDLSGFDPNLEAIAGFAPDLVISSSPLEALEALGIENMVAGPATNLDDIYTQIEQLGAATGNIDGATELVLQMQTDIDAVLSSLPASETPLTYYHELDNTLYSVTSSTFIGYVYGLFGLENIADPADADGSAFGFPQLNEEFLVTANPDIIFLADTICCGQSAETVAARPGWDQLEAVQAGNIFELNDDIVSRWGPRVVDFIEAIGTAVTELQPVSAG